MLVFKSIFTVIAAFLISACSSKIEGEAFVVTKGGDSKKLGLVEVQAYKMQDIEGFKAKILGEYSVYVNKISEGYKFVGLKEKYEERKQLLSEIEDATKKYQKCHTSYGFEECDMKLPKTLENDFEIRKKGIEIGASKIITENAVKIDNKFDMIYLMERVAEHTKTLEAIKTKTDADGKFTMTLPSGEFLIVATGSRQSLGEDYLWLIKNSKSGSIRLANDSIFDQGCSECLFTKDDVNQLNEKKKVLDAYTSHGNGRMMIYSALKDGTEIYGYFWKYMCGDVTDKSRVFEWAECVK